MSEQELLVISEDGYGKCTPVAKYPRQKTRGRQGVVASTNPPLAAALLVRGHDEVLVATRQGHVVRIAVADIPRKGRATRGVRVVRLRPGDQVSAASIAPPRSLSDVR